MKLDYYGFCNLLSLNKDNNSSLETYLNSLKVSFEQSESTDLLDILDSVINEILPGDYEVEDKYKMICKIFDGITVLNTVLNDPAVQYIMRTPYFDSKLMSIQGTNPDDILYNLYDNSIIKPIEEDKTKEEPTTDKKVDTDGYVDFDVVPNVDIDVVDTVPKNISDYITTTVDANGDYTSKSTGEVDANGDYI